MTPERIAELRRQCTGATWPRLSYSETVDLLATAEREAKLREIIERYRRVTDLPTIHLLGDLRAALESKGGA